jgi:hypothetical protein
MVSVLLGNGDGTFKTAQTFATGGSAPFGVAVADVNGDGKPDLVVANQLSNTVGVLLGNGDGTFQAVQTFTTGPGPVAVAVADLNGDGKLDIVTTGNASPNVSVLLGNGNGTFQAVQNWAIPSEAYGVAVADVNGDGKPDVIAANGGGYHQPNNTVSVLLGNGDGSFTAAQTFAVGSEPMGLAVADLNGDGRPDIVTANFNDDTVSVLLNTAAPPGTGTFGAATNFTGGPYQYGVAVGDVNGDGKPDLVTFSFSYTNSTIRVLLGNGNGTFQAAQNIATGALGPTHVALADVNGDGKLDIVTTAYGINSVSVLLGNGDGTFQAPLNFAVGNDPASVAVADVNGDGKPDLVVANTSSPSQVSVLLGNGNGTFAAPQTFATDNFPEAVAVADVNGDGKPDIVTANYYVGTVSVLLGNGNGTFQAAQNFATGPGPSSIAVADINGDGKPDLVTANHGIYPTYNNTLSVLLGNGNGTFQAAQNITVGTEPESVVVADVNGDGKPDLVDANAQSNTVSVVLGNGDGTFAAAANFAVGTFPISVAVADVNGDGLPDLITANYTSKDLSVLLGDRNPATHFQVIVPATTTAGGYIPVTVNALTAGNQQDDLYTGTVTLTSSDGKFVSTPPYTFTLADGGSHTFFVALKTAGNQTITATDVNTSSITGKATVKVVAAAATHLKITAPTSAKAGTAFTITVTALDAYGNRATSYRGTVHFSSTDGSASLPANYTFVAADKGMHTFSVTLKTTGSQTITATDTKTGSITGKAKITVTAAAPPPSRAATTSGGSAATSTGVADTTSTFAAVVAPAVAALPRSEGVFSAGFAGPAWVGGPALALARPHDFGAPLGVAGVPSAGIVAPLEEYPVRRRDIDYAFADPDGDLFGDGLTAEERSGKA